MVSIDYTNMRKKMSMERKNKEFVREKRSY